MKEAITSEAATTKTAAGSALPQDVIDEIVRRMLTVCRPDKIILFGSAATGGMTPDSDIDLLVVEPELERKAEVWYGEIMRIRRALGAMGYAFDVLLSTTERFERFKDIPGGIHYPAHKYGRVLYDAA